MAHAAEPACWKLSFYGDRRQTGKGATPQFWNAETQSVTGEPEGFLEEVRFAGGLEGWESPGVQGIKGQVQGLF